jgi:hypothetical protein
LEKIQLGSRVFSISLVTTESTRVLTNVATLVVCIGVFNQIVNLTPAEFIRETVFRNDFVRENFVFDDGLFPINLNKVFLKSYANMDSEDPYTFYRFLLDNYKDSRVVTEEEAASLSERELLELKRERAEEWRQEAYGNLPYTIDTKLTPEVFEDVAEEYYINPVENFSNNEKRDSELNWEQYLLVDREYIIPAGITLAVYFVLFAARFVLNYIVFIFTWIIWRVLIYFGFAKIDVESVEAEVVSI